MTPLESDPLFVQNLDKLAEVTVRIGAGVTPGQEVLLTAPLEATALARKITEQAYRAGASLVTVFYTDDVIAKTRYQFAAENSFDTVATWLFEGMASAYRKGAARISVTGTDPSLLSKEDPAKVGRASSALAKAARPMMESLLRGQTNWTIVASATPAWAAAVFPRDEPAVALRKLWDAIFFTTRVDCADPIANWKAHAKALKQRAEILTQRHYSALHYRGPGTDLQVGLADHHVWVAAGTTAAHGAAFIANLPTEEVFTAPHKDRAEGWVSATKPLSYHGTLIDGIRIRFQGGKVVEARADKGEAVFQKLLDSDEGARRLGEVALVPHSSPISHSGILFLNTLFDENASSHIAFGNAIALCLEGGPTLPSDALGALGANQSSIHVDWMIGSDKIDVDGITASGSAEPLMRGGEWV